MSRKILVVDDDRKTVDLLRLYLEKDGYQVLAAHDGRQALDLTRQRRPDLIVLDLMLPSVDGLDVCRILRAESARRLSCSPPEPPRTTSCLGWIWAPTTILLSRSAR